MKILELGMHFDPAGGGADRYFGGLLGGLDAIGADFTAAAFGNPSPTDDRISLGPTGTGILQRRAALKHFAQEAVPRHQVVATHFALYAFPILGQLKHTPHVVHFHGPWAEESAAEQQKPWVVAAKRFVERRVYPSATRLITLSAAFRDILVERYAIPSHRISIVPGGVDINHFQPTDRAAARQRLGWPADGPIIFCVRRLVKRMGLENLLDAFAKVCSSHPQSTLVIGGRGPLAEELKTRARPLGSRVIFAGFILDDALPVAYSAADFSIVPSVSLEGFGLITVESLACGTPVIVTPSGGLPETVRALDPSLILPDTSAKSLETGLHLALSQPRALPSRERCRDYAVNTFAWPVISSQVMSVYQEALSDQR
ncbi:glycosyltransferase family 4 protein [soil metagenome]